MRRHQYIHELSDWPNFYWDSKTLLSRISFLHRQQGYLLGRMSALGFNVRAEASLEILTADIIKSSKIEGEILDPQQVRSSLAKHLGVDIGGMLPSNRYIDGIVDMMLDATQHHKQPLTKNRLFAWHKVLFPLGMSAVGAWRSSKTGPMQVVSGHIGHERVHFEALAATRLKREMKIFLNWFNHIENIDPFLKAGIAHFWFVTIHPFEDGNGRIARAIADMCLARADGIPERFYSMSSSIENERKDYYKVLESCQKRGLDITRWLEWFLDCLSSAIEGADKILKKVLHKAQFWQKLNHHQLNERQRKILNILLAEFKGKLTTTKYAKIAKCSQDTALRDIQELIHYGVLAKSADSGRSTHYKLT